MRCLDRNSGNNIKLHIVKLFSMSDRPYSLFTVKTPRTRGYVRWILLALVALVVVGAGLFVFSVLRPTLTVTEVTDRRVVQAFYASGTVSPEREYPIRTPTDGLLAEVFVDKGDAVKRGQPLAFVSDPDLEAKVKQAQADLVEKQARADAEKSPVLREFDEKIRFTKEMIDIADREQRRLRGLIESSAATQVDLDRALDRLKLISMEHASWRAQRDTKLLELQREVDVAQALVEAAKENAKRQTLLSPIDGVVLDR